MSAVLIKTFADIRRRKVQTAIVALIVFLSSLTATVALTLLVESDAPFDRAFEQSRGAHLFVSFDSAVATLDQVRATMSVPAVSSAAGPWRVIPATILLPGGRTRIIPVAARGSAGGPVDRLSLDAGRWLQRTGEVVLSRDLADAMGLQVGDSLTPGSDSPLPFLRVVGIGVSIGREAAAWVSPAELPSTPAPGQPVAQYLVAYRLYHASTATDIQKGLDAITGAVPSGAIQDTSNYLADKAQADTTTAVMIPFLLAFSAFALLASAFIVVNLVGGAVIAGTRDIGIMKSIGFTPLQVVIAYAGQMMIPAVVGCLAGVPAGILLSQPFLSSTAHAFGLPRTFGIAPGVDTLGLGVILLVVAGTSVLASLKAGRQSAAAAIAAGSAPSASVGSSSARWSARLPLPRSLTLGLGDAVARPARSGMTVAAILIGVASVTFGLGLHSSLAMVAAAVTRSQQVQVQVYVQSAGKNSSVASSEAQLTSLISSMRGTARFVGIGHANVIVPGVSQPVAVTAYRGDASWIGYVVMGGRWFRAPGEVVAPSQFFTGTGHHLGDTLHVSLYGTPVSLKLVGEIFDPQQNTVTLRTSAASIPLKLAIWDYEVQLNNGTDPRAYAGALENASPGITTRINADNGIDTQFLLIDSVLAGLALVLVVIAIAGVFNTVVLSTREKARDIAILKALGMTPRQVVGMFLASVALLGLTGASAGIPAGIILHREILIEMGRIAAATAVPGPFFEVFGIQLIVAVVVAGVIIAMLGASVPAQWAARSRIADVLQTE